ncbi:MAG TPA: hypothetical protein ENH82_05855 [bacterium]|nr:hypothetical protein [bacterium]
MVVKAPASSKKPPALHKSKTSAPPIPTKTKVTKKFGAASWGGHDGEKILLYGDTGIGKSSLSLLAPKPIFLGLDDGGRRLRHPVTGAPLDRIKAEGKDTILETFDDVRAAIQQKGIFDYYDTVVIDTVTILQDWAEVYVVANISTDKGAKVKNLLGYGYNKGYKHLYNTMKLILQDCDALIRQNKNVILVAQGINNNIPNPGGEDFLRHGPRLHVDKSWDIQALYSEWCDHILRIDYHNAFVSKDKKVTGDTTRAVFVQPELHFRAKSRTVTEPVVSFENSADDSIWQFIFPEYNEEN